MKALTIPLIMGASLLLTVAYAAEQKTGSKQTPQQVAPAKADGQVELVVSGMT